MQTLKTSLVLVLVAIILTVISFFVKKRIIRVLIFVPSAMVAIVYIGMFFGKAYCELERLSYNARYSQSAEYLLEAVIDKLEAGQHEQVIRELKDLKAKVPWTYETRGDFDIYAVETADKLCKEVD